MKRSFLLLVAGLFLAMPAAAIYTRAILSPYWATVDRAPDLSGAAPLAVKALSLAIDPDFSDATAWRSPLTGHLLLLANEDAPRSDVTRAAIAVLLGLSVPSSRLLDAFADLAYFGRGCIGIDAAARTYMDTPPAALDAAQAAVLAAVQIAPSHYLANPKQLQDRAQDIYERMQGAGLAVDVDSPQFPVIPVHATCR